MIDTTERIQTHYTERDLLQEVSELVTAAIDAGRTCEAAAIALEVLSQWAPVEAEHDADKYTLCAQVHVRQAVASVLRRYRVDNEDATDRQIILPGMKRLQMAYMIAREGRQVVVPIQQITSEEWDAKQAELRTMAKGLLSHDNEIQRYREEHGV